MDLKIKPREPKLPTRTTTMGYPSVKVHGEIFRGTFPKVRLPLRPEDVFGQKGGCFSDSAAGVVTRKQRSAKNS